MRYAAISHTYADPRRHYATTTLRDATMPIISPPLLASHAYTPRYAEAMPLPIIYV